MRYLPWRPVSTVSRRSNGRTRRSISSGPTPIRPGLRADSELGAEAGRRAREWSACGAAVFVLLHHSTPVDLVTIAAELDPLAEAIVAAAGSAGLALIAETTGLHRRLGH